jgi:DNA-binding beta-propeller fold protein YncE
MMTPDGKDLIIANAVSNDLVFVDPATGKERRRLPKIIDPYQIGFSPDRKWLVSAALRLDRVDIYNAADYSLVARIPTARMPSHLDFAPDSSAVYVTLQDTKSIAAIDLKTHKVLWTAVVGKEPAGILTGPDGRTLFVGVMGEDYVAVVDRLTGKLTNKIKTGKGAHNLIPYGDNKHFLVSNRVEGSISIVEAESQKVVNRIEIPGGGGPDCMDLSPDRKSLWVTLRWKRQVAVIDLATGQVTQRIDVGRSPHGIYVHGKQQAPVVAAN